VPTLKILQTGDEVLLENFLMQHVDTSMFLRSNLREGGLINQGERFQGTYVAAIVDKNIVAIAAHYWNGMIMVQAPVYLAEVVQQIVEQSGLAVSGIAGPATQVEAAKQVLGLANRPTQMDEQEKLLSLALQDLQVPPALASGKVQCRLPDVQELELLSEWSAAFHMEALGKVATPDLLSACRREIVARQSTAKHWVLIAENTPVAYTAFNARLPDIVQIGGVWTPPTLRGKGYAKSVVAGSLLAAKSQGVERAILFTSQENHAAQAAYQGIGFRFTGEEFGLVLFQ
jgi:uncharacterized protein